jgi:putative cardiolipin synthase
MNPSAAPSRRPAAAGVRAAKALAAMGLAFALAGLQGCASLPAAAPRVATVAVPADPLTSLARAAAASAPAEPGLSGLRLLADGDHALEARLTLIRHAERSIDVQTYLLAADGTGLQVLQGLRDAAVRGVRVRLLVDDLYAASADPLLASLALQPGVQVRLFNPLPTRGSNLALRVAGSLGDFSRINHRMHNKLFLVDGAFAIAGGRNLADEYYARSRAANFVDMDVMATGAVVGELAALFDRYWNSDAAWPLQELVAREVAAPLPPSDVMAPLAGPDRFGHLPLQAQLEAGHLQQVYARVGVLADTPEKAAGHVGGAGTAQSQALRAMEQAQSSLLIVSPYFIPDERGVKMLQAAVDRDVQVAVMTNSLAATDEPAVHSGYARYRKALLQMGVALHEMGSALVRDAGVPEVARGSLGRLHAKLAVIDQRRLLIGSMNMDRRSGHVNTEMALLVDSPELAAQLVAGLDAERRAGSYRVRLTGDGQGLEWLSTEHAREVVHHEEPDTSVGTRLKASVMAWLVSEDLL